MTSIFTIPLSSVRVIRPFVGGAMGGKDELFEEALVALLAQRA